MTNKSEKNNAAVPENSTVNAEQVAEYLVSNPGFLANNPDILDAMTPPSRWDGDGVVDMQQMLMARLRDEIDNLRACAQDVIETSRNNLSSQTRAHSAVVAALSAADFKQLLRIINEDFSLLLDVEIVSIGFEGGGAVNPRLVSPLIKRFDPGTVDNLMGSDKDIQLTGDVDDDGTIFGSGAGLVRSAAYARLRPGPLTPTGLFALGARGAGVFHPGQGAELLTFLSRVVERCIENALSTRD